MRAYLCQIDGHSGSWSTGSPVTLFLASHDDERLCSLNGATWWPAIARLPVLRQDFFDGSFGGEITAPRGEMAVSLDALAGLPALALHDARIRLWAGELGAAWGSFSLLLDGRITDQPSVADGQASFSFSPDDSWLDKPLLPVYAGTGGLEGGADLAGNVKPLLLGGPRFCEAVLIDAVNQVHQLSAGSIAGVDLAFDRLSRYGSSLGNDATLSALLAASIPPGQWRTCLSQGLVRLGAPPDGLLTFHVQGSNGGSRGQVRRAGSIIWRIAELAGATAKVTGSNLDALDAARPWDLSLALTEQTTARQLILDIARSVNATAVLDWLGKLWLLPVQIGTAIGTLAADGTSLPPVGDVQQLPVAPPFWRLAQEAAVSQRVHADSEIAAVDLLEQIPAGANIVSNSHFRNGIDQWGLYWAGEAANGTIGGGVGALNFTCLAPLGTAGSVAGSFGPVNGGALRAGHHLFRVVPGMRIAWRLRGSMVSAGGARIVPYFRLLNAAATSTDLAGSGWGDVNLFAGYAGGLTSANGDVAGWFDVPATPDVFWLEVEFYVINGPSGGSAPILASIAGALIASIDPSQKVPPIWAEGPSTAYLADLTALNTAANTAAVGSTPAATVESGANAANAGVNADGTIKDDKVATEAVQAQAVAGLGSAYTSGSLSITALDTWFDAQSVVKILTGEPVTIWASVALQASLSFTYTSAPDSCRFTLRARLVRDGSPVWDSSEFSYIYLTRTSAGTATGILRGILSAHLTEVPAAGTYSYKWQVMISADDEDTGTPAISSASATRRSLTVLETKKVT